MRRPSHMRCHPSPRRAAAGAALLAALVASVAVAEPPSDGPLPLPPPRSRAAWLADLTAACGARPASLGCELWEQCKAAGDTGDFCKASSLTATVCAEAPQLPACAAYASLCPPGAPPRSPVCTSPGPLPVSDFVGAVSAMCESHGMAGCEECPSKTNCPKPAATLATLCAAMPGTSPCAPLDALCGVPAPTGPGSDGRGGAAAQFPAFCAAGGGGGGRAPATATAAAAPSPPPAPTPLLPPMRMWLHADAADVVLARQWVPRSPGAAAAACLGTAAAAAGAQALRAARAVAEGAWARAALRGRAHSCGHLRHRAARNAVRAAITFALSLIDLLLMLVAMTFSWPLILSVAGGYALGTLFLGHYGEAGAPGGPTPPPTPGGGAEAGRGGSDYDDGSGRGAGWVAGSGGAPWDKAAAAAAAGGADGGAWWRPGRVGSGGGARAPPVVPGSDASGGGSDGGGGGKAGRPPPPPLPRRSPASSWGGRPGSAAALPAPPSPASPLPPPGGRAGAASGTSVLGSPGCCAGSPTTPERGRPPV